MLERAIFLVHFSKGINHGEYEILKGFSTEVVFDDKMPSQWLVCATNAPSIFIRCVKRDLETLLYGRKDEAFQITCLDACGENRQDVLESLPQPFARIIANHFRI